MPLIEPHGGRLINRVPDASRAGQLTEEAKALPQVRLSPREQCDLEMIAIGAFSPLSGFMGRAEFENVCRNMRLAPQAHGSAAGVVFPIPVTLCPPDDVAQRIETGQRLALVDDKDRLLAVMTVSEKYAHDKQLEIPSVYRTEDDAHPGVATTRQTSTSSTRTTRPSSRSTGLRPRRRAPRSSRRAGARSRPFRRATRSTARTST
jgi:sulfate adenylyltransferase